MKEAKIIALIFLSTFSIKSSSSYYATSFLFAVDAISPSTEQPKSLNFGIGETKSLFASRGGSISTATLSRGEQYSSTIGNSTSSFISDDDDDDADVNAFTHSNHQEEGQLPTQHDSDVASFVVTQPADESADESNDHNQFKQDESNNNVEVLENDEKVGSHIGEIENVSEKKTGLKVLFLSADTGGGHRASAESLANQFLRYYPGTTYDLADIWTPTNVYPFKTLVPTYKHLSAHPRQWKMLYHISNTRLYEVFADFVAYKTCKDSITRQLSQYDPDVVVSVHPTMNRLPEIVMREIAKKRGKQIPFFTVVTDFGSGHCTWFQSKVDKVYIASDRILKLAKKRGKIPDEKIVMSGLPIRHDFAVQAENMGDRTSPEGKAYCKSMKEKLGLNPNKRMVLVMGGGEGVGSLSKIAKALYREFRQKGVDATVCVVCGRNQKLRDELATMDWEAVFKKKRKPKRKRQIIKKMLRKIGIGRDHDEPIVDNHGDVDVVGLGFITNMADYMVAADVLVSKAGPGTIAEATAVGLPVMITSYLPGQEAGNVDIVLDGGFGAFCHEKYEMTSTLASWFQDPSLLEEMSRKSASVGHPHAASDIILDIGKITEQYMQANTNINT